MIAIWKTTKLRCNPHAPYTDEKGTRYLTVPAELYEFAPVPTPPAGYNPDHYYVTEQSTAPYVIYTKKSDEQIAQIELAKAKQARTAAVEKITVTTLSGKTYDGDEKSQDRMARAICAMDDGDIVPWVLSSNIVANISKAELREALKLAGAAMAAEWVKPYAG